MPESDEDKGPFYGVKWELTFWVRAPGEKFIARDIGQMIARKVVMTDRGQGVVVIDVTGPLVGRPSYGANMRTARFSLDGIRYPVAPPWLIEAIQIAGFGRVEV